MLERIILVVSIFGLLLLGNIVLKWYQRSCASKSLQKKNDIELAQNIRYLIYFWSDHCEVCKRSQMPIIQKILVDINDDNVRCIDVCVDTNMHIAKNWKVQTLPTTFITNTSGNVTHVNNGFVTEAELLKQLEKNN